MLTRLEKGPCVNAVPMLPVLASLLISAVSGPLCVPMTDVCAPPGSSYEGPHELSPAQSGLITLRARVPLRALGVLFRAQTPVQVSVNQWGSSDAPGTRWAMVTVSGELEGTQLISGVRASGSITVGQNQSKKPWAAPQLLRGEVPAGTLTFFTADQVTLRGTTRLEGGLEMGGGTLWLTNAAPVTVRGLTFGAGTVKLERAGVFWPGDSSSSSSLVVGGELATPQRVGGLDVKGAIEVAFGRTQVKLRSGTLAAPTSLQLLGLPPGEAPAGAKFASGPASSFVESLLPVTVCGTALSGEPGTRPPRVTFERDAASKCFIVRGATLTPSAVVDGGPSVSGGVTLRLPENGCGDLGRAGTVGSGQRFEGLQLAADTTLETQTSNGIETVHGTLARPQTIEGRLITGEFIARWKKPAPLELIKGTLAAPSKLDAWELPVGTTVQKGDWGFSFDAPKGTSARAIGAHRGFSVDQVTTAMVNAQTSNLTLATPWRPPGGELAFSGLSIEAKSQCLWGTLATAQKAGGVTGPAQSQVRVCGAAVIDVDSNGGVPTVQFGRYFGTRLAAGRPGAPPSRDDLGSARRLAGPGYWLQINSLCHAPSGIPQPPPKERWVYLDKTGEPANPADRAELDARASRPGSPCPQVPCCVP